MKILLASNSPRRRELISMLDLNYETVCARNVDERYPSDLNPLDVAPYLSRLKAEAYKDLAVGQNVVLTADTVVILDGKILGKPKDRADAIAMLESLSGRSHLVVTGVTLTTSSGMTTFSETTKVNFGKLSSKDIEAYVDKYKPFDKAGAYGIQEWVGATGINSIEGCFYNVMGLPLHRLYQELMSLDML